MSDFSSVYCSSFPKWFVHLRMTFCKNFIRILCKIISVNIQWTLLKDDRELNVSKDNISYILITRVKVCQLRQNVELHLYNVKTNSYTRFQSISQKRRQRKSPEKSLKTQENALKKEIMAKCNNSCKSRSNATLGLDLLPQDKCIYQRSYRG